jgi:ABC-type branched-subunit amino acid transport system substrate-binding protein
MRLVVLVAFLITILHSGVSAQVNDCVPAQGEPLRIGAVFPPETLFGTDAADPYRGVQAMVAAVNACGGLAGRPVALVLALAGNYEEAVVAADTLSGVVPVVVGSGSAVVGDALTSAAGGDRFFYWEVSEPQDKPHAYALSPRPNSRQLGGQAAILVDTAIRVLLDDVQPLRVALVYEDNLRAQAVAAGVLPALGEPPVIEHLVRGRSTSNYQLAVQMREQQINVVILAAFEHHADLLWSQLREADANLTAWVQVGGDQDRFNMCERMGNVDGIISISAAGTASEDYRPAALGAVYAAYRTAYDGQFQRWPSERADLAASGMYMLLREILPVVRGDYTPATIQQAAVHTTGAGTALMGEGWTLDPLTWTNQAAAAIVSQRQNHAFCTLAPAAAATCDRPLQLLPTWRERARDGSC